MTSTTDKAGHPDVAEISDLSEGLLSPSRTEDVRQHLDECAPCADTYESLEEIRGLLGSMPDAPRMPDDVADRIDAALAAEALSNAPASEETEETTDADVDHVRVSRETSTTGRPSGHPRATTGPGRPHRVRHGRRRTALLATAFTAATLGLGAILVQTLGGDSSGKGPQTATQQESEARGTFSEKTLRTEVSGLLEKTKKSGHDSGSAKPWGAESQGTGADSGGISTLISPVPHVPECVEQGTGDEGTVLASKEGSYQGTGAYLLVLSDVSDNTKVTAYIVDSSCAKQAASAPGKLLLKRSYARP
ncbi:anti-sigma factor family protein [Streptomyces sp. NPDC002580]|uniref:anti-sigma factor family protein n=1 Tax=Streptomyces sp. NPDC002580 TaxID=3364653 RepID=UPI003694A444